MYLKAQTLDDLLYRVFNKLLAKKGKGIKATRGVTLEKTGVILQLTNPRSRLSRTAQRSQVFSCLGELSWYLAKSKSLEFIKYYIPAYAKESTDGKIIRGAYGPRLFKYNGVNQVSNVIDLLREKRSSRRAVIQIYSASDLENKKEVPCTCNLQYMIRNNKLHAITIMRSNDAYLGLPHDIFTFTMLQELIARSLEVKLGTYKHIVGSLHLYEHHIEGAQSYIEEGYQETFEMPPMPLGDQFNQVKEFLQAERKIRNDKAINIDKIPLDPYWKDLIRLLRAYRFYKSRDSRGMARQMNKMSTTVYNQYIQNKKMGIETLTTIAPVQQPLFSSGAMEQDL